ncbi:hypothetical protein HXX76_000528 [Chlamydomonas incerta]|uniref:Biotin-protein ligase N-terminal domain-containing protein n=1 Tax=Chlamydomonas incerta TaxID=51695 RepID=A0A836B2N2_CHLIN|nr:hypothetical protein HXX76_000528 [Chlamydomonas incerta]|eukprot:KAG2445925.1 hypothetical protein HXX76_000528 [Chlamydomonas incerta]
MGRLRKYETDLATSGRHGVRAFGDAFAAASASSTSRSIPACHASSTDACWTAPAPGQPVVCVYSGEGAGYRSARTALESAREFLAPGVHVRFLSTAELLEGSWADRCLLLIMPGGADLPYCKHLNGRGNRIIRGYVEAGGAYLGICAGAYYGCARVDFEPGSRLQVQGERELAFFPGRARGAAYSGFDYLSEAGSAAAPVAFRPPSPQLLAAVALDVSPRDARHGMQQQRPEHGEEARGGGGGSQPVQAPGLAPRHLQLRHKPSAPAAAPLDAAAAATAAAAAAASSRSEAAAGSGAGGATTSAAEAGTPPRSERWDYCRDYSNGGPVFELLTPPAAGGHAGAQPQAQPQVEVLAVYPELGNALAAVRCRVGSGVAVLCGTHPELPAAALGEAMEALGLTAHDPRQAAHIARLGAELGRWEEARRSFWLALLLACCSSVPWTGPRAEELGGPAAGGARRAEEEEKEEEEARIGLVVSSVHGSQEVRMVGAAGRGGVRRQAGVVAQA